MKCQRQGEGPTLMRKPFMLGRTPGWVKRGLAAFTPRTLCSTRSHSSSRLGESAFRWYSLLPVTIYTSQNNTILSAWRILACKSVFSNTHLTRCKTLRTDHLEDLFSISTSNVAGGVELNLTLRFPDHVTLWTDTEQFLSKNLLPLLARFLTWTHNEMWPKTHRWLKVEQFSIFKDEPASLPGFLPGLHHFHQVAWLLHGFLQDPTRPVWERTAAFRHCKHSTSSL